MILFLHKRERLWNLRGNSRKFTSRTAFFGIESTENAMELEFLLFDVFSIYSARMSWDFVETCTTEIKRLAFSRKTGTRKFILLLLPSLELERE